MVPSSFNLPTEGNIDSVKSGCLLARLALCARELDQKGGDEEQYQYKSLDGFVSYIFSHFAREEGEMNMHLYPNLQAHQEDHILCCCAVVDKFRDLRRGLSTLEDLKCFITHKLSGHVSVFDADYIRFLTTNNLL
jgi:hemerythrin